MLNLKVDFHRYLNLLGEASFIHEKQVGSRYSSITFIIRGMLHHICQLCGHKRLSKMYIYVFIFIGWIEHLGTISELLKSTYTNIIIWVIIVCVWSYYSLCYYPMCLRWRLIIIWIFHYSFLACIYILYKIYIFLFNWFY